MLIPQVAILLERLADDVFQFRWEIWIQPDRRRGRPVQNRLEDQRRGVAAERQCSRRHLVEHRAERKQIRSPIEVLALGLLRRHVGHGPQSRAWTGEVLLRHRRLLRRWARRLGERWAEW